MTEKDDNRLNSKRRTFLKGSAAAAFAATGLSAVPGSSVATSGPEPIDPDEHELPNSDVKKLQISEEVRDVTHHWALLTTDHDLTLQRVREADASEAQKQRVRAFLKDVWDAYPTERVTDGNEVTVELAGSAGGALGDNAEKKFDKAAELVADGTSIGGGSPTLEPQWAVSTHRKMAELSANKMGVSGASEIGGHADDPDYWDPNIPNWLPGFVKDAINQVMHSYGHYYNPSLLGGTGGAPSNAKEYFNKAQDAEDSGNTSNAREKAGWACHFIVDVGQPLHTGAEASQAANSSVHYDYEGWVNSNWDSGENFSDEIDNNTYYPINSPSQAVKDLADVSHDYVGTIFDTINNNPDSWKDDDDVIDATENVLVKTGYYNKGFLQEIF